MCVTACLRVCRVCLLLSLYRYWVPTLIDIALLTGCYNFYNFYFYLQASLLYKQTIKELESLRSQHLDVRDQIKGSFADSLLKNSNTFQDDHTL
jgi:hypothetical protein